MKTIRILVLLSALSLWPSVPYALDIHGGLFGGLLTMRNKDIKHVYDDGTVYAPFMEVRLYRGLTLGLSYEGGYAHSGTIGLDKETTKLSLMSAEAFLAYEFRLGWFVPFLKVGASYVLYKQTNASPFVADFHVDHKAWAPIVGVGVKLYPVKMLFFAGEIKYADLKVKPYEDKVDLSAFRFLGGIGFTI